MRALLVVTVLSVACLAVPIGLLGVHYGYDPYTYGTPSYENDVSRGQWLDQRDLYLRWIALLFLPTVLLSIASVIASLWMRVGIRRRRDAVSKSALN